LTLQSLEKKAVVVRVGIQDSVDAPSFQVPYSGRQLSFFHPTKQTPRIHPSTGESLPPPRGGDSDGQRMMPLRSASDTASVWLAWVPFGVSLIFS